MTRSIILSFLFLLILEFSFSSINAQENLPDVNPESPSALHNYYKNYGQIIDDSGYVRNDILYYTERLQPRIFLANDKAYFVIGRLDSDSINFNTYRIDMDFINPELTIPTITTYEQGNDYLNYYLPHCGTGITDVEGYQRVVYENVFPNIDFNFYSNSTGFKSYIVIKPGGNPNDILLKFSGQDSINVIDSNLILYLTAGYQFALPEATAYQIDSSNSPLALSWDPHWVNNGNGEIALNTSTYNTSLALVIRIATPSLLIFGLNNFPTGVHWSTYSGGSLSDAVTDVKAEVETTTNTPFLYQTSRTYSLNFPQVNGFQKSHFANSSKDVYIGKFDDNAIRKWATYYGGAADETPNKIAIRSGIDNLFLTGTVSQINGGSVSDLTITTPASAFGQTTFGGGTSDAFILAINKNIGSLSWSSYLGGSGDETGNSVTIVSADPPHLNAYFTGTTTSTAVSTNCSSSSGKFPLCSSSITNAYNQQFNNGNIDGFVLQFNEDFILKWSTLFGGDGNDIPMDIKATNVNSDVVICGKTTTSNLPSTWSSNYLATQNGKFPLAGGSGAYVQKTPNEQDAFLAKFDDTKLVWSTLFGGSGADVLSSVAFNSSSKIYATGTTKSSLSTSSCSANTSGHIPICNSNGTSKIQSNFGGGSDALILEFDRDGVLKWSTYFGGWAEENRYCEAALAIDKFDNIYISGTTWGKHNGQSLTDIETLQKPNLYFQGEGGDFNSPGIFLDGYFWVFGTSNELKWGTFFGDGTNISTVNATEIINCISVNNNGRLFIGGEVWHINSQVLDLCPSPLSNGPFCFKTLSNNTGSDGFITEFDLGVFSIGLKNSINENNNFKTYSINNKLVVEVPFDDYGSSELTIYDMNGKKIANKTIIGEFGIVKSTFDISNLSSGI